MKYTPQEVRKAMLEQDLRVLIPIVKRLARAAGPHGSITVANLKLYCKNKDVFLASTAPRYRSGVFGQVMLRAGLAKTGARVYTPRKMGGNYVDCWTLPEWAPRKQTRRVA